MNDKKGMDVNLKVNVPGLEKVATDVSSTVTDITKDTHDGVMSFLSSICSEAAREYGQFLAEKVKFYRYQNRVKFLAKANKLHDELGVDKTHIVHPKLAINLLENAPNEDDDNLQDWWAGLLVSSCDETGSDDNLIFIDLMNKLTRLQALMLEKLIHQSIVVHTATGILYAENLELSHSEIVALTECEDINRLDREIDSLRNHGLVEGGYDPHTNEEPTANLTPTSYALHFYARCQGVKSGLIDYYNATLMETCPNCGRSH